MSKHEAAGQPLPSSRHLLATTLRQWSEHWKLYLGIALVVSVPINLVMLIPGAVDNSTITTVSWFATVVTMSTILFAVIQIMKEGKTPTVRESYYDGSALMVRFTVISAVLALCALPFGAGVLLASIGTYLESTGDHLGAGIWILIATGAIVLALPSFWLLIRYVLAPYVASWEGLKPVSALRRSRALTLGRFWRVGHRMLVLALMVLLIGFIAFWLSVGVSLLWAAAADMTLGLIFSVVALPLAVIYLTLLYRALAGDVESEVTEPGSAE